MLRGFPRCSRSSRPSFSRPTSSGSRSRRPAIARKRKAGQFVILRLHAHGERIPLTIADSDPEQGTITIIVQGIGKTTKLLNMLDAGDAILDLVGPLGKPSDVEHYGTVVVIGGGVGAAIAYPTARAMKRGRQPRDLDRRRPATRSW